MGADLFRVERRAVSVSRVVVAQLLNSRYHLRMNRRDLLKFFAAGTVIAPVSGSAPLAKLIEVPNVELVKPAAMIEAPINLGDIQSAKISLEMYDGTKRQLDVDRFFSPRGDCWINPEPDYQISIEFAKVYGFSPTVHKLVGHVKGNGKLS